MERKISGHEIDCFIRESQVILETERHLYLYHRGQDIRFPCIRDGNKWIIKSAIVKGMWMEAKD
ncbi:MAG: hypothetical protein WB502_00950 [Thermoactinomyces sp.]